MTQECDYKYFTVYTDSLSSESWIQGSQTDYVSHLTRPIKDVVEVSILNCSVDTTNSNVIYIKVDEFDNQFHVNSMNSSLQYSPAGKGKTNGSLIRLNRSAATGRTVYNQYDYDTNVEFTYPIRKVDRITTHVYNENGLPLTTTSNIFVTYKLKSKLENICN